MQKCTLAEPKMCTQKNEKGVTKYEKMKKEEDREEIHN